ncbi:hypothetical protein KALB_7209 [Kutzneria albida DSM 43870]|uniref:Secreted protein n=1 Tax=Kutzneria albida DSM 43870 TaxID=1449976 RepID=W5WIX5_9PSEU|nr:hypothetical protein KALB_7209 [Kutzneria albida DSM 43870]
MSRRGLLRLGLLAAAALPLAAACTGQPAAPPAPDPLADLARAAETDAATAREVAARFPGVAAQAGLVATNRSAQATALRKEIDRVAPPTSSTPAPTANSAPTVPGDQESAVAALVSALTAAQKQAAEAALTVPSYRAGLVGSVAAGCASLKEVLA